MPRYDQHLASHAQLATDIVKAGEIVHSTGIASLRREWKIIRLEFLYELAYLRVFSAWESCLESVFYRSLCGYAGQSGQETLVAGTHYPTLAAAEAAVLGTQQYKLWHNPAQVVQRCQGFIRSGVPGCPGLQESVISSHSARLIDLAAIRHRIVHEQKDAKNKFDAATLTFVGRTYSASRPGKFLRDWDNSPVPRRWLDVLADELVGLASQIV